MKSIKDIILNIFKGIFIVLLSIILIINVYVIVQAKLSPDSVPSIFGYKPFIVLSGSMETEIYVGDLVVVKEVDAGNLKINDIIAFRSSDSLVTTHRIVNVVNTDKGRCFETKGDNNNSKDDSIVCPESIEGKLYTKYAKIGGIILFIQEPLGFLVIMLSLIIVCIFIYLISNKNIIYRISDEELKEFEEFKKKKQKKKK